MNKRSLARAVILCLIAGLLLVAGCGTKTDSQSADNSQQTAQSSNNDQSNQAVQQVDQSMPNVMVLANNPTGTLINTMGNGIATELTKTMGVQVKASTTNGPQEYLPLLASGEADMGILNNWDAQQGWLGKGTYAQISNEKGFPISIIASSHKSQIGILVADKSDIKTGADLKGKKYAGIVSGSPGITLQDTAFLADFGLTPDDVTEITVPNINAAVQAVLTGQADATGVSLGAPSIQDLAASSKGARFLSLDVSPEAAKRMTDMYPGAVVKVSPSAKNVGITQDTNLLQYEFYLAGRNDLSETAVYNIVKALWDNNQELTAINSNLSDFTTDNFVVSNFTIPYHPGAIKFYQEKGVWNSDLDKRQQELLATKK